MVLGTDLVQPEHRVAVVDSLELFGIALQYPPLFDRIVVPALTGVFLAGFRETLSQNLICFAIVVLE